MEKLVYLKIEKLTVFAKCWQSIRSSASAELCSVQCSQHFGFLNPHLLFTVRVIWRTGCWEFLKSDVCSFPCLPKACCYHINCQTRSCVNVLLRSSKQWIDFHHVYSWKHSCENDWQLCYYGKRVETSNGVSFAAFHSLQQVWYLSLRPTLPLRQVKLALKAGMRRRIVILRCKSVFWFFLTLRLSPSCF